MSALSWVRAFSTRSRCWRISGGGGAEGVDQVDAGAAVLRLVLVAKRVHGVAGDALLDRFGDAVGIDGLAAERARDDAGVGCSNRELALQAEIGGPRRPISRRHLRATIAS